MRGRKMTTEEFVEKAKQLHGSKYSYDLVEYSGAHKKIKIVCPLHGMFVQRPSHHLKGQGCKKCANEKQSIYKKSNKKEWITKARKIHGNRYDYSLVEYQGAHQKIKIVCPLHGIFFQTPDNHINHGQGCPRCFAERQRENAAKSWSERYSDNDCILYLIECYNEHEKFLKVGVTSLSVEERYNTSNMPYSINILDVIIGDSETCYYHEQRLVNGTEYYKPNTWFAGYNECLYYHMKSPLLDYFEHYKHELN